MEKSSQRGRKSSRTSAVTEDSVQNSQTPMASLMRDSSFGVQSLVRDMGNTAYCVLSVVALNEENCGTDII